MTEKRTYVPARPRKAAMTAEAFASGSRDALIRRRIASIIDAEAPVTEELLTKRLINSFGLFRNGPAMAAHLLPLLGSMAESGEIRRRTECGVPVYFTDGEADFFRTHTEGSGCGRYSYQVPPSEAACCIRYIRENGGKDLSGPALLERFRNEFGWKKAGSQVSALFQSALSLSE